MAAFSLAERPLRSQSPLPEAIQLEGLPNMLDSSLTLLRAPFNSQLYQAAFSAIERGLLDPAVTLYFVIQQKQHASEQDSSLGRDLSFIVL